MNDFVRLVSRITTDLDGVEVALRAIREDVDQGRLIVEECRVDPGSFRTVIQVSVREVTA